MEQKEFTQELKNKRLASGLSQGQLAELLYISRYSINRFENGKANAGKETQNRILRCLNYYISERPFYLLIDYLSIRFPTTDARQVIRKVLGMKADYFIHYDFGYYGYQEHYTYGEIKVMVSSDEHMGVFLELKGMGCRNLEHILQAQERDWYAFLNRCIDCGGIIKRFDLAVNDVTGLLDINALDEKYQKREVECRSYNFKDANSGKLSGNNFLFINGNGNPKVAVDYNAMFTRMVKKYNKHHEDKPLPHITPHTLRHTFCTRLASKNMNPKDLQYIMGHSNISITMNWYAHASIDTAKSEVQRLIA